MAILKEKVNLVEGSTVNHELINDTVETSVEAYKKSVEAHSQAGLALKKTSDVDIHIEQSERKLAAMQQVVDNVEQIADDIEQKAKMGQFNGRDGMFFSANGLFGFQIEDSNGNCSIADA